MSLSPHRLCAGLLTIAIFTLLLAGCRSDELTSSEQQVLEDIFRSGLQMQDDPYVRAETLRVLELTGDPRFTSLASPYTRDSQAVVRIAALRLMLVAEDRDAHRRTLNLFTHGDEDERLILLETVLEHGSDTLRQTILERSLRNESPLLRLRALEAGLLTEIDETDGDLRLRQELLPELGRHVDDDDPRIAARALKALINAGQHQRADQFIDRFLDSNAPIESRRAAGNILVRARVEKARSAFETLLERAGAFDPDALGIPQRRIDNDLLRTAVLGLATLGDTEFVRPAQEYGTNASTEEVLELLEALATNPSPDAAITLSSAMRDVNTQIRRRAIALYGMRDDALFTNLQSAMNRDDFEAQKTLAAILAERFPESWQEYLRLRLARDDQAVVEDTLRTMQTLLRTEEELAVILPLRDQLESLATSPQSSSEQASPRTNSIQSLAAYLLFRISEEGAFRDVISQNRDPQSRYAYLEFLLSSNPTDHTALLREHLFDDLFALRLMAAAGLAKTFADDISWSFVDPTKSPGDESDES